MQPPNAIPFLVAIMLVAIDRGETYTYNSSWLGHSIYCVLISNLS